MAKTRLADSNAALARTMGDRLGVTGADLEQVRHRAGRWLPWRLRRDADYLIEAEMLAAHPKLRHLVDPGRSARAERHLRDHLATRDPVRERTNRLLGQLAAFAFNVLLFAAIVIGFMWWRGLIGPSH
ncbi:MAG: hypothetical protein KDA73_11940 [Rhodobacteraceae bacterium]|nr:hypothetical protein [Paracoccaceae bacterium]